MQLKLIGLLVVLALASSPVRAEEGEAPGSVDGTRAARVETGILRGIYAGTFAVHFYEAKTSLDVIALGGREIDPILSPLASNSTAYMMVALARATAINLGVHGIARHHRIVAISVAVAINGAFLAIAAHNSQVADTMRPAGR